MTLQLTMLYLLLLLEILMLDLQSGGLWQNHNWKYKTGIPYNCAWVSSTHITTHPRLPIFFLFLIFTDQTNWIVDSGVHPSLHSNCHHLIMYCKLNLNIKYPPPYLCLVWDYNKANVESIKKSIVSVNWELMFSNTSAHKQVSFSNEGLIYFQILLHINL